MFFLRSRTIRRLVILFLIFIYFVLIYLLFFHFIKSNFVKNIFFEKIPFPARYRILSKRKLDIKYYLGEKYILFISQID